MKLKILFFSQIKEIFGESERTLDVPEDTTIEGVLHVLSAHSQADFFKNLPLIFAVNENFENLDKTLRNADVLAIMTPMSGG